MESQFNRFNQRCAYRREISKCSKPFTVNGQRDYKKRYCCLYRCSDVRDLSKSHRLICCLPEETINYFIECYDKLDLSKTDASLGTVLHRSHVEQETKHAVCIKNIIVSSSRPLPERKPQILVVDKMAKGVESIPNHVENYVTISLKSERRNTNSRRFNSSLVTPTSNDTCLFSSLFILSIDNALDDGFAKPKNFSDLDKNNNVVNYPEVKKHETEGIIFPPSKAELHELEHRNALHKVLIDTKEILQQIETIFECRGDCCNLSSLVTPEVTRSRLDFETDGPESVTSSPRHPEYRDKNNRLISFTTWRHKRVQDPHRLTNYGFFYTGQGDLVRCFYCGLGLKDFDVSDDALLEHVRYSSWCPYLLELLGQRVLDDFKAKVKAESVRQEQQPNNSDPGTNDVVRCFYCDGGLQRWDPTDDPWIEHCRWFHTCRFVREMKGDSYVEQVKHYYQSRPNQQQVTQEQATNAQSVEGLQGPMVMMSVGKQPMEASQRTVTQVVSTENTNTMPIWRTSAAELVLEMGFKDHEVKQAVQQLQAEKRDDSPELIIEVIEKLKKSTETKSTVTARKAQDLLAENSRLKSMPICMGCNQEEINALFLPCQHHKFCTSCSEGMTHCPVCGKAILHKVKTYLS